jgi:hypothetical protein
MKYRTPLLASLISASMLFTGAALAQQSTQPSSMPESAPAQQQPMQPASMPATPPAQPSTQQSTMPAPSAPAATTPATTAGTGTSAATGSPSGANSATFNSAQGQVTVNSKMGQAPSTASPPSFEQLANGKKAITKEDANAYPPLANDFEYAAHNGNSISKAQYERWLQNLN